MKAVNKLINEINEHYEAIKASSSPYLIRDRYKCIKRLEKDLIEYCFYKGYNYKKIMNEGVIKHEKRKT